MLDLGNPTIWHRGTGTVERGRDAYPYDFGLIAKAAKLYQRHDIVIVSDYDPARCGFNRCHPDETGVVFICRQRAPKGFEARSVSFVLGVNLTSPFGRVDEIRRRILLDARGRMDTMAKEVARAGQVNRGNGVTASELRVGLGSR